MKLVYGIVAWNANNGTKKKHTTNFEFIFKVHDEFFLSDHLEKTNVIGMFKLT